MKRNLPARWLLAAITMFALSNAASAQRKRVVPSSLSVPADEKATVWTHWTRLSSNRWVVNSSNGDPPSYLRVVMPKATLKGVVGTLLSTERAGGDVFIPDINSGSTWVSIRMGSDKWNMRWRQYSKASTKPLSVAQPRPIIKQPQSGNPIEFLEAIRDNRMSDVRRMLGQDRSLANAYANLKLSAYREDKFSPMRAAMHFDRLEMGRLLLQSGASRRYLNAYLFSSVYNGEEEWVKMLVGAGASVNARNGDEGPPLFLAVGRGNLKMAKLLKSLGADLRAQNTRGYTPSEYATLLRNSVMADVLRPR